MVTSGGPRVFDPNSAAWYETLMGESAVRFVNNMDVVPSVPFANNLLCAPSWTPSLFTSTAQ